MTAGTSGSKYDDENTETEGAAELMGNVDEARGSTSIFRSHPSNA